MKTVTPPLKWHGDKHYLARRIVALMPPHLHYVEPLAGLLARAAGAADGLAPAGMVSAVGNRFDEAGENGDEPALSPSYHAPEA